MPDMKTFRAGRASFAGVAVLTTAALLGGAASALLGTCGPFTDVAADSFCPFVLEIFYLGITTGTTPTTYDPTSNVSRLQMATFLSRTVDGVLKRGSRRAILDQFWTTQSGTVLGVTTLPLTFPGQPRADGADIWVPGTGLVSRVRASDGKLLDTWTGAITAVAASVAMGKVLVVGSTAPGSLYRIDPDQPAGSVTTVASTLGNNPTGIAFDGARFWTANNGGSVSIVTPGLSIPWTVTTVAGFSFPDGVLWDGSNIWVTEAGSTPSHIKKLDANGAVLQTVTVGTNAEHAVFDGTNIWVPDFISASVSVVRPASGAVLATLTGNGVASPISIAFDGQRILVANQNDDRVSLFKAADLSPLGFFPTGAASKPFGTCSDGVHFWITLQGPPALLARF